MTAADILKDIGTKASEQPLEAATSADNPAVTKAARVTPEGLAARQKHQAP
jgi:hypothetical protein